MNLDAMEVGEVLVDKDEAEREEWFRKRSGKFTCSRFADLLGSGRKKEDEFSQTAMTYIYQVAAERLGSFVFPFDTAPVRWGKDNESEAIERYVYAKYGMGLNPDFVTTGTDCYSELNNYTSGTQDAWIGSDGCLEVKCPYTPQEHLRTVFENQVPSQYVAQVYGHLLVSGRTWCDFVSFDPRIGDGDGGLHVIRVERNEAFISNLKARIDLANEYAERIIAKCKQ